MTARPMSPMSAVFVMSPTLRRSREMARSPSTRNALAPRAVVRCMQDHDIREFRAAKDEFLRTDHHSPIPNRSDFEGLAYFEPDPAFEFTTRVEPADGSEIQVQTSDGQIRT